MSSDCVTQQGLAIRPLTFLQTYQSADVVIGSLLQQDADVQRWLGPASLRTLFRYTLVPLYYHWATSGYGAFADEQSVGWMYLRGWYQVLYIETLVVHSDWQQQPIGTALLHFAETQAREQRREWLALTVTNASPYILEQYEAHGFERGHWRLMHCEGVHAFSDHSASGIRLVPLIGQAVQRVYHRFAHLDVTASDAAGRASLARFLTRDPYRRLGRNWLVVYKDQPIGYLNGQVNDAQCTFYLASDPHWWGSPAEFSAVHAALEALSVSPASIDLRLASSGHHEAARQALGQHGFAECSATTVRMYKNLSGDHRGPAC